MIDSKIFFILTSFFITRNISKLTCIYYNVLQKNMKSNKFFIKNVMRWPKLGLIRYYKSYKKIIGLFY